MNGDIHKSVGHFKYQQPNTHARIQHNVRIRVVVKKDIEEEKSSENAKGKQGSCRDHGGVRPKHTFPLASKHEAPLLLHFVCSKWRCIAIDVSELWTAIDVPCINDEHDVKVSNLERYKSDGILVSQ